MFTTMFQIFLFICVSGLVLLAISTWLNDNREQRNLARENGAQVYARTVINDRVLKGEYEHAADQIEKDYELLRTFYHKKH